MFSGVLVDRGRPLPSFRSLLPVASMRLIKSDSVLHFHSLEGNSRIIRKALHPFSNLSERIKILSSFDNGAIVYNWKLRHFDVTVLTKNI